MVEVAGGLYDGDTMQGSKPPDDTDAPNVVFRPAPGATVVVRGLLAVNVAHVELRNMAVAHYTARYDASLDGYRAGDLVFRNVRTRGCAFTSVRLVSIIGGEIGPNLDGSADEADDGCYFGAWPVDVHPTANIRIEDVHVHNVRQPDPSAHSDCIQFTSARNVTLRNVRFDGCQHADVMIKGDQGPIENVVIERSHLGRTLAGYFSINLVETSRGCRNVVIRRNVALQNIRTDSCSGASLIGNRQPSMSEYHCSIAVARIDWNIYGAGVPCGKNDRVAHGDG